MEENNKSTENNEKQVKNTKNFWQISTFILGVMVLVLLVLIFSGSITGNAILGNSKNIISGEDAGEQLVNFLNQQTGGGVEYISSNDKSDLYEITVSYQGQEIPVYITKDGEYFIEYLTPLTEGWQTMDEEPQPVDKESDMTGNIVSESSELAGDPDKVTIYFFWGDGCPHCAEEKPFLESLEKKYGEDMEVKMFETYYEQGNQQLFQEAAQAYGIQIQGVPTTFIGDQNWVGYVDYMGEEIEDYVKYCIENKCESPLDNSYEDCDDDDEEDFCVVE